MSISSDFLLDNILKHLTYCIAHLSNTDCRKVDNTKIVYSVAYPVQTTLRAICVRCPQRISFVVVTFTDYCLSVEDKQFLRAKAATAFSAS